jgi:arylsulfotransferase ASST
VRRLSVAAGAVIVLLASAGCGSSKKAQTTTAEVPPAPTQHFRSRPDLQPPIVRLNTPARGTSAGYLFLAPKQEVVQAGPLILDDAGRVVWFRPLDTKGVADFRVQQYRGQPVLTWWRGTAVKGIGNGYFVIVDRSYRIVASVRAANGLAADIHEFVITPRNTALFAVYHRLPRDLSPIKGPKEGAIQEGIVQEVDIATGRLLFEWHSDGKVAIDESYAEVPPASRGAKADPYDYFHINSVAEDGDGNLLISARNTQAIYKINRKNGSVMWRLGGKRSDFTMGPGTRFAWQHDARRQPDGTITLFDNEADPKVLDHSRVLVLRLDERAKKATLVRSYTHAKKLLSGSQGNAQFLPNGHIVVGWGAKPYVTELDRAGRVLLDLSLRGQDIDSYRAYRFRWTGRPADRPAVSIDGDMLYVSWNGATEVARWRVLVGTEADQLSARASVAKDGFETAIPVGSDETTFLVEALNRGGGVLGRSVTVVRKS